MKALTFLVVVLLLAIGALGSIGGDLNAAAFFAILAIGTLAIVAIGERQPRSTAR